MKNESNTDSSDEMFLKGICYYNISVKLVHILTRKWMNITNGHSF